MTTNLKKRVVMAFDVSTKSTGYAMIYDKTLITAGVHLGGEQFQVFSGDKVSYDAINWQRTLGTMVLTLDKIVKINKLELDQMELIALYELSHHGSKEVAMKLATYVGLIQGILSVQLAQAGFSFVRGNLKQKHVNPREWQLRIFNKVLDRDAGKALSLQEANKFLKAQNKEPIKSHDVADAINIARVGLVLRDNFVVGQERRTRLRDADKRKKSLNATYIKLNILKGQLMEKKQKQIERKLTLKKFQQYPSMAVRFAKEFSTKPLSDFAAASQLIRLNAYKDLIEKNNGDLAQIREFGIKGVK